MPQCHYTEYGNQYWQYDRTRHMIINSYDDSGSCLSAKFEDQALEMRACDDDDENQRWVFTYENVTALDDWKDIYGYGKFTYGNGTMNKEKMLPMAGDVCNFI
jgi:hypothetical protein